VQEPVQPGGHAGAQYCAEIRVGEAAGALGKAVGAIAEMGEDAASACPKPDQDALVAGCSDGARQFTSSACAIIEAYSTNPQAATDRTAMLYALLAWM
jgi:hypothetical protein